MLISLRSGNPDDHDCGGSILSDSYILTAAHCIPKAAILSPANLTIVAGITDLSDTQQIRRVVDRVYVHEKYVGGSDGYRHDIAVLHLKEPLPKASSAMLTKTCIHRATSPNASTNYITNGTRLTIVGWGTVQQGGFEASSVLRQVELYAVDNVNPTCMPQITQADIQFCAGVPFGGRGQY